MIGDVLRLIDEIAESIRAEQADADAAHNMQRSQCNELLPEYASKIAHHTEQKGINEQRVVDTNDLLTSAEGQLATTRLATTPLQGQLVAISLPKWRAKAIDTLDSVEIIQYFCNCNPAAVPG